MLNFLTSMKKVTFFKNLKVNILLSVLTYVFFIASEVSAAPSKSLKLPNPLRSGTTDPNVFIGSLIKSLLGFVGTIALVMFIYGGFLWMLSAGNPDKVKKGKDTFIWAILGIVVVFTSYLVINTVLTIFVG